MNNVKITVKKIMYEGADWIQLLQGYAHINKITNVTVQK
jgi:hypothetical protein